MYAKDTAVNKRPGGIGDDFAGAPRIRPLHRGRYFLDRQLLKSLLRLGSVVEARDPYTGGHLWRVAQFAKLLSARLELSPGDRFRLTVGAYLHDLGKVGIPESVLLKKGELTEDEFALIRTHPAIGASLLREHPLGHYILDVVEHHRAWIDGGGYPGLAPREKLTAAPDCGPRRRL